MIANLGELFSSCIKNRTVLILQHFLPAAGQTDLGWIPGFVTG